MINGTLTDPSDVIRSAVSFLFVPGDRPERYAKALNSGADVVIVDLEDAVAEGQKGKARQSVAEWLSAGGRACVRINDSSSPHHHPDLEALAHLPGLLAVMLAKASGRPAVTSVSVRTGVPVIALIESAEGVAHAHEIAAAPEVIRLAFGHLDYALDLGAEPVWPAMLHARSTLVFASRLAGLPGPIDGVSTALDDPAVLADDLMRAKEVGMTGKLLVHPKQVPLVNAAFLPDDDDIRWARSVMESARNGEAIRVDGHMVDAPILARAESILRKLG